MPPEAKNVGGMSIKERIQAMNMKLDQSVGNTTGGGSAGAQASNKVPSWRKRAQEAAARQHGQQASERVPSSTTDSCVTPEKIERKAILTDQVNNLSSTDEMPRPSLVVQEPGDDSREGRERLDALQEEPQPTTIGVYSSADGDERYPRSPVKKVAARQRAIPQPASPLNKNRHSRPVSSLQKDITSPASPVKKLAAEWGWKKDHSGSAGEQSSNLSSTNASFDPIKKFSAQTLSPPSATSPENISSTAFLLAQRRFQTFNASQETDVSQEDGVTPSAQSSPPTRKLAASNRSSDGHESSGMNTDCEKLRDQGVPSPQEKKVSVEKVSRNKLMSYSLGDRQSSRDQKKHENSSPDAQDTGELTENDFAESFPVKSKSFPGKSTEQESLESDRISRKVQSSEESEVKVDPPRIVTDDSIDDENFKRFSDERSVASDESEGFVSAAAFASPIGARGLSSLNSESASTPCCNSIAPSAVPSSISSIGDMSFEENHLAWTLRQMMPLSPVAPPPLAGNEEEVAVEADDEFEPPSLSKHDKAKGTLKYVPPEDKDVDSERDSKAAEKIATQNSLAPRDYSSTQPASQLRSTLASVKGPKPTDSSSSPPIANAMPKGRRATEPSNKFKPIASFKAGGAASGSGVEQIPTINSDIPFDERLAMPGVETLRNSNQFVQRGEEGRVKESIFSKEKTLDRGSPGIPSVSSDEFPSKRSVLNASIDSREAILGREAQPRSHRTQADGAVSSETADPKRNHRRRKASSRQCKKGLFDAVYDEQIVSIFQDMAAVNIARWEKFASQSVKSAFKCGCAKDAVLDTSKYSASTALDHVEESVAIEVEYAPHDSDDELWDNGTLTL